MRRKIEKGRDFFSCFRGKNVLVTGHTGFKGAWLSIWLHGLGANVFGYSQAPDNEKGVFQSANVSSILSSDVRADIRDQEKISNVFRDVRPDVVFHLAAQPLVRESYAMPRETHEVNYMGTCNLLEAVRVRNEACAVVIVTTDKCYKNKEQVWGYRENDRLGGHDPYSASKAAAEIVAASYRDSFFPVDQIHKHGIGIATARAGNVIGGGDWAKDRIVPDMVRSLIDKKPVDIRNPHAVRPWQHVLEPLHGYLSIASQLLDARFPLASSGWNFGPGADGHKTVGDLVSLFHELWGDGDWEPDDLEHPHETSFLSLAIDKAVNQLGWTPTWGFGKTVLKTVEWYRSQEESHSLMLESCQKDIAAFTECIQGNSLTTLASRNVA